MLIDELHINKAEAKQLLQEQGSVKKAFDAYKTNNCITKNDWKYEKLETKKPSSLLQACW